jgi:hypothetical protein
MIGMIGHVHFVLFFHANKYPKPSYIVTCFMYDFHCLITYIFKNIFEIVHITKALIPFFFSLPRAHIHISSRILEEPQHPYHYKHLRNLPPILGGVPNLVSTSAQLTNTPMSATIVGLALLGYTLLGTTI